MLPKLDVLFTEALSEERFGRLGWGLGTVGWLCSWREAARICVARDASFWRKVRDANSGIVGVGVGCEGEVGDVFGGCC